MWSPIHDHSRSLILDPFLHFSLPFFRSLIAQDARTLAMVENVAERRKKWESLRKEYASKFPRMAMTLPKNASLLSNYALDGYNDLSSTKSKRKQGSHASKGYKTHASMSRETAKWRGSGSGRSVQVDGLMRKNRESTLDLLVVDAGL